MRLDKLISNVAQKKKCAIYNELSHMNPLYLTTENPTSFDHVSEAKFHLRNLTLLSLYFNYIIIPLENIVASANARNKLVVEKVYPSSKFQKLLKSGIIKLCGWGSYDNSEMVQKSINYSFKNYRELKSDSHIKKFENDAQNLSILTRDITKCDLGHDEYLKRNIFILDSPEDKNTIKKTNEFIENFYGEFSFLGSQEFYYWLEKGVKKKLNIKPMYMQYYKSWQEYCCDNYSPAITINSERIPFSLDLINVGSESEPKKVYAALFSPPVFYTFIKWQLSQEIADKLIYLNPDKIISLRNGDWSVFVERYHQAIMEASNLIDTINVRNYHDLLNDPNKLDEHIKKLFVNNKNVDPSIILDSIGFVFPLLFYLFGVCNITASLSILFKNYFKYKKMKPFIKDVIPFYKKITDATKNGLVMQPM